LALVLNPPALVLAGRARGLPRDLQSILRMALAADPARRYRNARDLEADLDRYAAKLPVAARAHTLGYLTVSMLRRHAWRSLVAACLVLSGAVAGGAIYHRHRQLTERHQANLRQAYALTAFTLGQIGDELRAAAPGDGSDPRPAKLDLAGAAGAAPAMPVNAVGELDLRYYQAQLADLRSATAEGQQQNRTALLEIQRALNLYSQLALEAPDDPSRLLDAARARLNFARLLERKGRTEAAGLEAGKTLRQLDRLAAWPGFDPAPLPPLRCSALRLAAMAAHRAGDAKQAVEFARERVALAGTLPGSLATRSETKVAPPLALAVGDLATYAIAAGEAWHADAGRELDRAIAAYRTAHEQDQENHDLVIGLAHCLHARAELALRSGPGDEMRALIGEGAGLLIGENSSVWESAAPLVRDFCTTATTWAGLVKDHPDPERAQTALRLALQFAACLRNMKGTGDQIMFQRSRLFLYESHLACRLQGREHGAAPAASAVRLLQARQRLEPDRLSLALLTATALHHARAFAEFPAAEWNEQEHGALLARLLKQLTERAAELTPEQRQELSRLQ
jgi:hypothetical protein